MQNYIIITFILFITIVVDSQRTCFRNASRSSWDADVDKDDCHGDNANMQHAEFPAVEISPDY